MVTSVVESELGRRTARSSGKGGAREEGSRTNVVKAGRKWRSKKEGVLGWSSRRGGLLW